MPARESKTILGYEARIGIKDDIELSGEVSAQCYSHPAAILFLLSPARRFRLPSLLGLRALFWNWTAQRMQILQQTSPLGRSKWNVLHIIPFTGGSAWRSDHSCKNSSYENRGQHFLAVRPGIAGPQMVVSTLAIVPPSGIFPSLLTNRLQGHSPISNIGNCSRCRFDGRGISVVPLWQAPNISHLFSTGLSHPYTHSGRQPISGSRCRYTISSTNGSC
jgi:hypothetical protein